MEGELRKKSDSRVEGLAVIVRGTKRTVHADGHATEGPQLSDGQLQHRADEASGRSTVASIRGEFVQGRLKFRRSSRTARKPTRISSSTRM